MIGYCERIEKTIWENVFEQKKKKLGRKFNPGLVLISLPSNNWTLQNENVLDIGKQTKNDGECKTVKLNTA